MADSSVTKTMLAMSCSLMLLYTELEMRALLHRSCKSPCNETNGTTTIVVPPVILLASNMNNMLLPLPVPITTTTRLSPLTMASIAASYCLWNQLPAPNNPSNLACTLTAHICCYRYIYISCPTSSYYALLRFCPARTTSPSRLDANPKNQCYSTLTC
jgi:hypothetical protein